MTTSRPAANSRRAASSIAKVLPTPAHMPKKTFSRPRRWRASSRWSAASKASGFGRRSSVIILGSRAGSAISRNQLNQLPGRLTAKRPCLNPEKKSPAAPYWPVVIAGLAGEFHRPAKADRNADGDQNHHDDEQQSLNGFRHKFI